MGDGSFVALAALEAVYVVGGLLAYVLRMSEQALSEVYIFDLAVAAGCRREGIAAALIEHLRGVAAGRGAWVVNVQVDLGDAPAIALYSKFDNWEGLLHFDIAVAGAN